MKLRPDAEIRFRSDEELYAQTSQCLRQNGFGNAGTGFFANRSTETAELNQSEKITPTDTPTPS